MFSKLQIDRSFQQCSSGNGKRVCMSSVVVVRTKLLFLLVSLPMHNAPAALWKALCVSPRILCWVPSAKLWKMSLRHLFTITATLLKTRFLMPTAHMLFLHSASFHCGDFIVNSILTIVVSQIFLQIIELHDRQKMDEGKKLSSWTLSSVNPSGNK